MPRIPICALAAAIFGVLPVAARTAPGALRPLERGAPRLLGDTAEILAEADAAKEARCSADGFHGEIDQEGDRKKLETNGDDLKDLMLKALNSTGKGGSVPDALMEEQESMIRSSLMMCTGLVMFILMITLFPCCQYMKCMCKRCCPCVKRHKTPGSHLFFKIFCLVFMTAGGVMLFYSVGRSVQAYKDLSNGVDNLACTSAKFVHGTLSMMNDVTGRFDSIELSLASGSTFITDVRGIINSTAQISGAITTASDTLNLLSSMLSLDGNQRPSHGGSYLKHKCISCAEIATQLGVASTALGEGVGTALNSARSEVDTQLADANLGTMREALRSGIAPMIEVKDMVSRSLGPLVKPSAYDDYKGSVDSYGLYTVVSLILLAGVLASTGSLALFCFLFSKGKSRISVGGRRHVNKSATTRHCACCTWCCGWMFTLVAFLIGGLLMLLCVPMSTVCLIMDDLNKEFLNDVGGALNLDLSGDQGVMMTDIVVQCFNPADANANPNLLDLVFTRNDANEKQTIREQLIAQVADPIRAQFDALTNATAGGDTALETNEGIVTLKNMLSQNRMDTMIVTDIEAFTTAPIITSSLFQSTSPPPSAFFSSAGCNTEPLVGISVDGIGDIRGIEELLTDMSVNHGGFSGFTGALGSCVVPTNANCNGLDDCTANTELLNLKSSLVTQAIFRCDLWTTDGTTPCDIRDLEVSDNVSDWCAKPDGTREPLQIACTLPEFVAYVQDFSTRISKAIGRVDYVSNSVITGIGTDMRGLVDTYLINPLLAVVDVVTCGYLGDSYREVVYGLCYQGINGLSSVSQVYVALGFAVLLLIIVMDALWLRTYMVERPAGPGTNRGPKPKPGLLGRSSGTTHSGETE